MRGLERFVPREFLDVLKESCGIEEKFMAIYTKALKPEFFKYYRPAKMPPCPSGWVDEYQVYTSVRPQEKSSVWREMLEKFGGYIRSLEVAKAESLSNKTFLRDMEKFFADKNMPQISAQINQRLAEFEMLGVV